MADLLSSPVRASRPAFLWLVLLAVSLAALGSFATVRLSAFEATTAIHAEGLDDAYISYRFALNLVNGHGLVWNPGERIEGFSNLLWVLASAALLEVVSPDRLHLAICLLSTLLAIGTLLVFHGEMRRRSGDVYALIAAALWVFYPFLWIWISSGLEVIAVVLLQLLIWRSLSQEEPRWPALFAYFSLLILLRADGFVMVVLAAGHFMLDRQPRRAVRALLLGVPATLALFLFRRLYYDDWWPSTYYVKVTRTLVERVISALVQLGELLTVFLLAPFVLALLWQLWRSLVALRRGGDSSAGSGASLPTLPPEVTLGGGLLAYWLYIGGDVFKLRFLLVLIPFGLAAMFGIFARNRARRWAIGAAGIFLCAYAGQIAVLPDFRWQTPRYDAWITLGRFLGQQYPGAWLAAEGIGKVAYFSGLPTIDMLGLCDAHISKLPPARHDRPGHEKSDGAYVLARRPDLIVGHLKPFLGVSPDLSYPDYSAAGYRIAYLVNIDPAGEERGAIIRTPPGPNKELFVAGYRFVVLLREGTP